ncbi:BgTH12-07592 [Blumeria graminis f. sp. triticale]|uniref:BgTH12-07592 n=2 Tax=Blumeria graminis TaxID=34373 RepID=A0A9W4D343_BLUGR|nr:BgTH12-07592 [Blumeria graminis f. sp. triticale]
MGIGAQFLSVAAPAFIILSPFTSYADQTYSIYRNKSSAGFSLDIPLIMLVASLTRIFYYPGAKFDTALLIQSFIMIFIQLILLKLALEYRPSVSSKGGESAMPFVHVKDQYGYFRRPYQFWQWRSPKLYWKFLLYYFIFLTALELLLSPFPGIYSVYSSSLGILGLSVEATLPLPQIISNHRLQSCKGFRISVLVSWLAGDFMKMMWFFTANSEIPWTFKLCGLFQTFCDLFLGFQYFLYGMDPTSAKSAQHEGFLEPIGKMLTLQISTLYQRSLFAPLNRLGIYIPVGP